MRAALLALALLAALASDASAQREIHLGVPTQDPSTAVSVHWIEDAPAIDPQVVLTGPDGERSATGRRVDGPSAGFAYEATFEGLAPATEYAYRVGDRELALRTAPANGTVRVVALADMGTTAEARAAVEVIADLAPDAVLHMGDVSYAEGDPVEWSKWFEMVEPVAASRPWIPALGNHETYTGSSAQGVTGVPSPVEIAFYQQRFGLPGNELWYSFDLGPAHVVALDTFSERAIPEAELRWLEEDLAAHANATWTIAFLHEPPWSSNANHGSSARAQEAFVPLFERHGVDLVLAGHDHSYERTAPMNGVTYVVSGGGGAALYAEWEEPAPEWSAAREAAHHVLELTITPEAIQGRVVPTAGSPFEDAFTIGHDAARAEETPSSAVPSPALAVALPALAALARALRRRA